MKRSKAYQKAAEMVDFDKLYAPREGIDLAKQTSSASMDATVEVAMRLGVDPRKADQMVRGVVNLPNLVSIRLDANGTNNLPCLARSLPPLIDPINLDGAFGQQVSSHARHARAHTQQQQ